MGVRPWPRWAHMHAASLQALKRGSRASFRHGEQGEWYRGQVTLSEDEALLTCANHDALPWRLSSERQHTELSDVARVERSTVPGRGESMRLLLTSPQPSAKLAEPQGMPGVRRRDLFVVLDAPEEARAAASALLELLAARGLVLAAIDGDVAAMVAGRGEGAEQGAEERWRPPSVERAFSPGAEEAAADCWAIAEGSSTPTTKLVVEASPAKPRPSGSTGRSSGRRVPRTGFLEESPRLTNPSPSPSPNPNPTPTLT